MLSSRFRGVNSLYCLHRRAAPHKLRKANSLHSLCSLSASLGSLRQAVLGIGDVQDAPGMLANRYRVL